MLPLLANQGPDKWKISCEFADLFGTVPDSVRPYLPSFRHALVDLPLIGDSALSTDVRLRTFLKALKYSRRPDLPDCIDVVMADAPALEDKHLSVVLTYLDKGPIALDYQVVGKTLQRLVPDRKERMMGWLTQPFYDKGLMEGEAKGEARGEAKVLTRLLEKRFGTLPVRFRERIFAADLATIDAWVERAFDAPDLLSIFESN